MLNRTIVARGVGTGEKRADGRTKEFGALIAHLPANESLKNTKDLP